MAYRFFSLYRPDLTLKRIGTVIVAVCCVVLTASCSQLVDKEETNPLPNRKQVDTAHNVPIDPALQSFYEQKIHWKDCPDRNTRGHDSSEELDDLECATVTVPVDYSHPEKATTKILMNRVSASSGSPKGSLFINPGGPGSSGTNFLEEGALFVISEEVRDEFDVIGFDPRGVGRSDPVKCLTDKETDEFLANSDALSDDSLNKMIAQTKQLGAQCLERSEQMTRFADTYSAAKDLDIMRAAVGDEKLTFLGFSYGSYLGQVYAELFGANVGRMVLDGVLASSFTYDEVSLSQAKGMEASLRHWVGYCQEQGRKCPVYGLNEDEAIQKIRAFLDSLVDKPLPTSDPHRQLTSGLAFTSIIGPLYSEYSYDALVPALRSAMVQRKGDQLIALADRYNERNPDGTYISNSTAAFMVINNLDYRAEGSQADWDKRAEKMKKEAPFFGAEMSYGEALLSHWPVQGTTRRQAVSAKDAPPILLIGNLHDPATPYEMAVDAHKRMPSTVLITYDSYNHTAYGGASSCVNNAVDDYFLDGVTPSKDVKCH
ncbi:MAG: alpha/beta hydrolase [Actinomycetaceae bacterium]|nr:alpha/beta hydrolase [Actinomycetaceae bacterium]